RRMLDLAERAQKLARRFGLRLHAGHAGSAKPGELPALFQRALDGAERALSEGSWLAEPPPAEARKFRLSTLRRELAKAIAERPAESAVRFARYAEAVARVCGYRLESVERELCSGFERVTDVFSSSEGLEARAVDDLLTNLEQRARQASTTAEVLVAYQSAIDDLGAATQKPSSARHEHNLRRALGHIQEHYCEPLSLARVARVAGFARNYFSALFKRREGTTFEKYVLGLRLGRARDLLSTTELGVQRVAELSGLGSRQYLSRVFRRELGTTPSAYRKQRGPAQYRK
ncbi:MAG TPA: AraC family transcriptional regulator, partial [Polyangiaceae bacterium]|nr:AraC family transcriptional regulator [Polyangiaceae bacterium]